MALSVKPSLMDNDAKTQQLMLIADVKTDNGEKLDGDIML